MRHIQSLVVFCWLAANISEGKERAWVSQQSNLHHQSRKDHMQQRGHSPVTTLRMSTRYKVLKIA